MPESLKRLRDADHRLAALTNSPLEAAEAKLKHAGLYDYFEQVLSADRVERLKPAREPYHMAAEALSAEPGELLLVAAHDWDVAGALRPGKRLRPLMEQLEIVGADLSEVAAQVLAEDR